MNRIAAMVRETDLTPYVDLHLPAPWTEDMIGSVAGREHKIREMASRVGAVILGGAAPIWAYLAGLRCALLANTNARIFFFDPKQQERLVEIPARHQAGEFPPGLVELEWNVQPALAELRLKLISTDKFLPPSAAQALANAPWYGAIPKCDSIGLYGPGPTWLYATYARWLMNSGVRRLSSWDARQRTHITIWE
ncbi:MAG TPA: hypothetical protein VFK06_14790 [Candidatus Angelobacter sp.]|nr:hypothetical protein [Candidatus Angelobacter sp.]